MSKLAEIFKNKKFLASLVIVVLFLVVGIFAFNTHKNEKTTNNKQVDTVTVKSNAVKTHVEDK